MGTFDDRVRGATFDLNDGYGRPIDSTSDGRLKIDVVLHDASGAISSQVDTLNNTVADILGSLDGYSTSIDGYDGYNKFGNSYQYTESEFRSSTTQNSFQTKLSLTTSVASGTFLVSWTAVIDAEDIGRVRFRDTTNNSTISEVSKFKPTDSSDDEKQVGSFRQITLSGTTTYEIQWRSKSSGDESGIQQARIVLWKVNV